MRILLRSSWQTVNIGDVAPEVVDLIANKDKAKKLAAEAASRVRALHAAHMESIKRLLTQGDTSL